MGKGEGRGGDATQSVLQEDMSQVVKDNPGKQQHRRNPGMPAPIGTFELMVTLKAMLVP